MKSVDIHLANAFLFLLSQRFSCNTRDMLYCDVFSLSRWNVCRYRRTQAFVSGPYFPTFVDKPGASNTITRRNIYIYIYRIL